MPGLIAYGSLMSEAERELHKFRSVEQYPVTVAGFRRSFSQEPSWRRGTGKQRGVLTVAMSKEDSLNAILISGIPVSDFAAVDHRERGYDRVCVPPSQIRNFDRAHCNTDQQKVFIYIGKLDLFNSGLEPNADYLNLCVNAAFDWGAEFRDAFLRSTFVSETHLIEYDRKTADGSLEFPAQRPGI